MYADNNTQHTFSFNADNCMVVKTELRVFPATVMVQLSRGENLIKMLGGTINITILKSKF